MRKAFMWLYKESYPLTCRTFLNYYLQLASLKVVFAGIFDVKLPVEIWNEVGYLPSCFWSIGHGCDKGTFAKAVDFERIVHCAWWTGESTCLIFDAWWSRTNSTSTVYDILSVTVSIAAKDSGALQHAVEELHTCHSHNSSLGVRCRTVSNLSQNAVAEN